MSSYGPSTRYTTQYHENKEKSTTNFWFWLGLFLVALIAFSALAVILISSNYFRYTGNRLTFNAHGSVEHPNGLYFKGNVASTSDAKSFLTNSASIGDFLIVGPLDSGDDKMFSIYWKASNGNVYYHDLLGTLA